MVIQIWISIQQNMLIQYSYVRISIITATANSIGSAHMIRLNAVVTTSVKVQCILYKI